MTSSDGFSLQFRSKKRIPDSVIRELFYLRNSESRSFCLRNPESWTLKIEILNSARESGNPLQIGIRNPRSSDKESGIQYLESRIHGVESRIQDFLWFPFIGRKIFVACLLPFHLPFQIWPIPIKWVHLVWIRAWWLWNGIKLSFKSSELEYFCIDYFLAVAPFVQFSYVMPDVDEPWKSWKMNWQFLVSKPCTVWPYTGTITLLSLPKGLFGDHLQKRQDQKEKIITIITTINSCIVETRQARGEVH